LFFGQTGSPDSFVDPEDRVSVPRSRQRESCRKAIFGAFHLACKRWGLEQTNGRPCVGKLNLYLTLFELILTSRQSRYLRLGLPADRLFLVCEAWRIAPTEIISAHKAGANFVRVLPSPPAVSSFVPA